MIAAFDLGVKNFAFAVKNEREFFLLKNINLVEDLMVKSDLLKMKKEKLVELQLKLGITSPVTKPKKKDIINLILSKTKIKSKENVDLGLLLFKIMDTYKDNWEKCDVFLVERQMITNFQALKLSHYLEAYLKIHFPTKKILNYNATNKTKNLGAIDLKSKKDRKLWTINYVSNLLTGDNLKYFQSLSKQDDVADVVCMIESYLK
jgi:hypothetical protein